MLRTALRNILAHKARLTMTALAVLLGVAFVSGTLVFSDTVGEALKNASARSLKDVAVSVRLDGTSAPSDAEDGERAPALDGALAEKIGALPSVASVRSSVSGDVTIAGKDHRPLGGVQNLAANYVPGKDGADTRYPGDVGLRAHP